ncbi:MAG: hypothetical protein NTV25_01625 [Methanothrix sp.]|jgi:hypothetical protein|nr:hypothetical protein [Methanothrix sp.]
MAEAIRLVHSSGWIIQYIRALLRLWIMNRREAKVFWCRREKKYHRPLPNILYVNCRYIRLSLQKIEMQDRDNQKTEIEVWGGPAPIRSALAGGACHCVKA